MGPLCKAEVEIESVYLFTCLFLMKRKHYWKSFSIRDERFSLRVSSCIVFFSTKISVSYVCDPQMRLDYGIFVLNSLWIAMSLVLRIIMRFIKRFSVTMEMQMFILLIQRSTANQYFIWHFYAIYTHTHVWNATHLKKKTTTTILYNMSCDGWYV